ncbi:probable aspartic protease At2g35615 [Papaver somniferum]|uniref:probable aspartic protease At2g35615 n=1 Tax=Papaver somniferum TaxID=3469 RepID=UPI000E6FEE08|nr:probable aspartic protease At2g35615 [Papaver somniferum]
MGINFFIFLITITHVSLLLNSVIAVYLKKGFGMKMIHIDSKESLLYPGNHLTRDERLQRLVEQSRSQARYIESQILVQINETRSMDPDVARLPVVYEPRMFYVVKIGLGTFPGRRKSFMNYYLMIDTGSDQTWLQCKGATKSFTQDMPLYPWNSSTTYRHVACNTHPLCKGDKFNVDGQCTYVASYMTGSVTSDAKIGGAGQKVYTTPIVVPKFRTQLYYLNLEDISVGNKRVRFSRGTFKLSSKGEGGTAIDSGTPISIMYKDHFDRVADLVKEHFNEIDIEYIGSHQSFYVCFRLRGRFDISKYPSITLHFQQSDYVISDYKANFIIFDEIVCLGISRGNTKSPAFMFGAMQQSNKRILYNIMDNSLSFATEYCELDS